MGIRIKLSFSQEVCYSLIDVTGDNMLRRIDELSNIILSLKSTEFCRSYQLNTTGRGDTTDAGQMC